MANDRNIHAAWRSAAKFRAAQATDDDTLQEPQFPAPDAGQLHLQEVDGTMIDRC